MNQQEATQAFGRFITKRVRDKAIELVDKIVGGVFSASRSEEAVGATLRAAGVSAGSVVTTEIVDATVCQLLLALDCTVTRAEGGDDVFVKSMTLVVNDQEVVVEMQGELCGWYQGGGGWVAEHSRARKGSCASDN